jgi:hypothetical protein
LAAEAKRPALANRRHCPVQGLALDQYNARTIARAFGWQARGRKTLVGRLIARQQEGAWLQFEGNLIGQGKDAAQKAIVEKPELAKKIVDAIMAKRNGAVAA